MSCLCQSCFPFFPLEFQYKDSSIIITSANPAQYYGLNIVGLRRRNFERETINTIHEAYRIIYQGGMALAEAIETIQKELPMTDEIRYILDFIDDTKKRGFVH